MPNTQKNGQSFLSDVKELRRRARESIEKGAVTSTYGLDPKRTIEILQSALATEIVCVLRYTMHAVAAQGINSNEVRKEFEEHAADELEHMNTIADRINQLGGVPNMNPEGLLTRSHSEYGSSDLNLVAMIKENLIAERIAVESYTEIIRYLDNKDVTTRTMMEKIHAGGGRPRQRHARSARRARRTPHARRIVIELICVRHGRTAWNADLRFQGQTDVPLDELGRAQARGLAALLRRRRIDRALASDLVRAADTARAILESHPQTPLEFDPELREMAFGAWEGLTWAQIVAGDPSLASDGFHRPRFYTPPGGETFAEVVLRARRAVDRTAEGVPEGSRVLVVTHAGVLRHVLLPGRPRGGRGGRPWRPNFAPASVTLLRAPGIRGERPAGCSA